MKPSSVHYDCAVVGEWHLAFTTASCLAKLGHRVVLVNPLHTSNSEWRSFPDLPLREPGMPELIAECRQKGLLHFANGITSAWTADRVWLAIDTPVNERDEADVRPLERVAQEVAQVGNCRGVFITSSQIPLGFSSSLEKRFGLELVYIPENLRLGHGIDTFLKADRTVIGARLPATRESVREFLKSVETDFFLCDLVTAEMIKHATNAFLATSISFANELARVGEQFGVDNLAVAQALKLDKRIGKKAYVSPGLGFAGGTLPRDLRILQKLGRELSTPTPLVNAVLEINENTAQALGQFVRNYLAASSSKQVLILGYTYKAETDTLRRSSSLELARDLVQNGITVFGYDPMMNDKDLSSLKGIIHHCASWGEIPLCADACVVMTPRPEFSNLDWKQLISKRTKSDLRPLILDARAIVSSSNAVEAGFAFKELWQPVRTDSKVR